MVARAVFVDPQITRIGSPRSHPHQGKVVDRRKAQLCIHRSALWNASQAQVLFALRLLGRLKGFGAGKKGTALSTMAAILRSLLNKKVE